ncbi:hypothetical protein PVAND_010441 [Polypedilum vanderplanki]|uniref:Uncharacterized protein n=1 Tax=Polypedilum vanderplanki TaxID=319348 RepID=A0A9J6CH96_POLVA|nr:hypothetical protein PVAND_010441 [Polypedilum vanderplanki]
MLFISLIRAHYAIRVDTDATTVTEKSESAVDQPKAEALTLVIKKHVPLRPVKVIERKDDVVVIHTSKRSKRKQTTRRQRRPSNQYRSKIKHNSAVGSPSNFGGFKDFSSNDSRFAPFSQKPGRATNKYKYGPPNSKSSSSPPVTSYEYNAPPPRRPQSQPSRHSHGSPASSFNHIESHYAAQPVTLQQQQSNNLPSFSINSAEPPQNNNYFNNEITKFSSQQPSNTFFNNEISKFPTISSFPLGGGSSFDIPKTSYGEPVRSASNIDTTSYQFNSNVVSALNNLNKVNSNKVSTSNSNNFPKLPAKYETSDFSTPTRHNPLNSNSFTSDFTTFDLGEKSTKLSTNSNYPNRFNKFNNYDYDFRNHKTPLLSNIDDDEDDEDDEDLDYLYSTTARPKLRITPTTTTEFTTTTRKFKKGVFGKRKRPVKFAQEHNLDTDDLRDAFTDATNDDFHEVALNSEDFLNFDSQRNVKKNHLSELRSNLKLAKKNPALRSALGEDFQILSVQKSLEKNPSTAGDIFQRRRDENFREFRVGGDIRFSEAAPVVWNGDMNNKPLNHRF